MEIFFKSLRNKTCVLKTVRMRNVNVEPNFIDFEFLF